MLSEGDLAQLENLSFPYAAMAKSVDQARAKNPLKFRDFEDVFVILNAAPSQALASAQVEKLIDRLKSKKPSISVSSHTARLVLAQSFMWLEGVFDRFELGDEVLIKIVSLRGELEYHPVFKSVGPLEINRAGKRLYAEEDLAQFYEEIIFSITSLNELNGMALLPWPQSPEWTSQGGFLSEVVYDFLQLSFEARWQALVGSSLEDPADEVLTLMGNLFVVRQLYNSVFNFHKRKLGNALNEFQRKTLLSDAYAGVVPVLKRLWKLSPQESRAENMGLAFEALGDISGFLDFGEDPERFQNRIPQDLEKQVSKWRRRATGKQHPIVAAAAGSANFCLAMLNKIAPANSEVLSRHR